MTLCKYRPILILFFIVEFRNELQWKPQNFNLVTSLCICFGTSYYFSLLVYF